MRSFLPFLFAPLLLFSCKRAPVEAACHLSDVAIHGINGFGADNAHITYSDSGVSLLTYTSGMRIGLHHTGGLLRRRDVYSAGVGQELRIDSLFYNGGRTPVRLERFRSWNGSLVRWDSVLVEMNNGHLSSLRIYSRQNASDPMLPEQINHYTYNGDNIAALTKERYQQGALVETASMTFTADNQPNHFNRIDPELYLWHPQWVNNRLEELYLVMNANNLLSMTANGSTYPFTYTTDAQGRLTGYGIVGDADAGFDYRCP